MKKYASFFLLWSVVLNDAVVFDTNSIALEAYDSSSRSGVSCNSLGYDFFDSTTHSCATCSVRENKTASLSVDGAGNSDECVCKAGMITVYNDCTLVSQPRLLLVS